MSEDTLNSRIVTSSTHFVRFSYFKGITGEMVYSKKLKADRRVWSTMILIPKSDKVTVKKIKDVVNAVAKEKWGDNIPKTLKISFRDGDKEGKNGLPEGTPVGTEPYTDHYFLSARSDRQPTVVDQQMQPILDPGAIVSGDYGIVSLNCFHFDNEHGKGISFGLGNIQLAKKGEPLGGKSVPPEEEFKPIAEAEGGSGEKPDDESNDIFD